MSFGSSFAIVTGHAGKGFRSAHRSRHGRTKLLLAGICASLFALAFAATPAFAERAYEGQISGVSNPWGIAIDGHNHVAVDEYGNSGEIAEYNDEIPPAFIGRRGSGGHYGGTIHSIAIDNSSSRLYVADSGPVVVDLFENVLGEYIEQWTTENGCGYLYVAVDNSGGPAKGRVYIARSCSGPQHIQAFKPNHEPDDFSGSASYISENHITGTPNGEIGTIINVATDEEGNFYIVDQSNKVVDEFNSAGVFLRAFEGTGAPEPFSGELTGVAVDPTNGDVLIVDSGHKVVDEFTATGEYLNQLTGPTGENFGTLNGGIAVNSNGDVYVANSGSGQVDIFGPNAILPKITYGAVTDQTQTSGTVHAEINLNAGPEVTGCKIEYGTNTGYGSSLPCSPTPPYTSETAISAELTGLTTETSYHYRVVLTTANGTKKGSDQTYLPHAVAGLTTEPATSVERNCATVNGTFNGNGEDTHYDFEWGTEKSYGNSTPSTDAGSGSGSQHVSYKLCGLQVQTVYHYRIVASNAVGTSRGLDASFETLAAVENLTTEPASGITATTATLNGSYTGIGEDVHYYFEWGTTDTYGNTSVTPPGTDHGSPSGTQNLSFDISKLNADTTYHYRIVAIDAAGTTYGADKTFMTLGRYQFSTNFGSAGTGDGQLSHPKDVAVDNSNGDIFVADTGNHRVVKYDSSGNFLAAWGWGVADGEAKSEVCTSSCQAGIAGSSPGQFGAPTFIEVDNSPGAAGDVYVADTGDGVVQKFEPSGQLIETWGTHGAINFSTGGAIGGITVDNVGNLYVLTDNTPFYWTKVGPDGVSRTKYETDNNEEVDNLGTPGGNGIDISATNLWYETQEGGGGVRLSSPEATIYQSATLYPESYGGPNLVNSGLAINRSSYDVFVDQETHIDEFTNQNLCSPGERTHGRGCPPSDTFGNGNLTSAHGLAVRPSTGVLYAANTGANNLAVFSPLPLPGVTTGPAKATGSTTGTLTGHVDPAESGQISECYFEYVQGPFPNEVQTLTLSGVREGTFTLTFKGETTAPITYGEGGYFGGYGVQNALEALPAIGSGNVRVTREKGEPYSIEFIGALAEVNVPQLTANGAGLGPAGATMTPATVIDGHGWSDAKTIPCAPNVPLATPTEVSAELSGLTPFGNYHYRLIAIGSAGKGLAQHGRELTYTPTPLLPASVDSTSSSEVGDTTATLTAEVNPNLSPTSYRFQYGPNTTYAEATLPSESIGEDGTDHAVSAKLSGLSPGITYHFRVQALNFNGVTSGPDQTFTTLDGGQAAAEALSADPSQSAAIGIHPNALSGVLRCGKGQARRGGTCVRASKSATTRHHRRRHTRRQRRGAQ